MSWQWLHESRQVSKLRGPCIRNKSDLLDENFKIISEGCPVPEDRFPSAPGSNYLCTERFRKIPQPRLTSASLVSFGRWLSGCMKGHNLIFFLL